MAVRNKIIIQGAEAANIDAFTGICVLNQKISLDKLNSKKLQLFYTHKVLKSIKNKTGYKNINWYNSKYGKLSDAEWENIFILPHILPVENKVKEMQYKILFRYVPTNKLLYKIKRKTSPNCHMCLSSIQTIEHLFFECSIVKTFWAQLWESWGKDTGNTKLDINLKHIILGFKWEKVAQNREINIIILKAKFYIFLCHINEKELILNNFYVYLAKYVLHFTGYVKNTEYQPVLQNIENWLNHNCSILTENPVSDLCQI